FRVKFEPFAAGDHAIGFTLVWTHGPGLGGGEYPPRHGHQEQENNFCHETGTRRLKRKLGRLQGVLPTILPNYMEPEKRWKVACRAPGGGNYWKIALLVHSN